MAYPYRRSYERFLLEIPAEISTEKFRQIPAILTDMSACGVGVLTNVSLCALDNVEIMIKPCFFFKEILKKKAKVAWCKKICYDQWKAGLNIEVDDRIDFS